MKYKYLIILLLSFCADSLWAQSSITTVQPVPTPPRSTDGLRVGLLFSQLKGSYNDNGDKKEEGMGPGFGISAGAAYIPVREIGVSANFALLQIKDKGQKTFRGRIDANVDYALNDYFSLRAGLNLIAPVFPIVERSEFSVGYQTALAYQIANGYELALNIIQMRISYNSETDARNSVNYTGTELALTKTF